MNDYLLFGGKRKRMKQGKKREFSHFWMRHTFAATIRTSDLTQFREFQAMDLQIEEKLQFANLLLW